MKIVTRTLSAYTLKETLPLIKIRSWNVIIHRYIRTRQLTTGKCDMIVISEASWKTPDWYSVCTCREQRISETLLRTHYLKGDPTDLLWSRLSDTFVAVSSPQHMERVISSEQKIESLPRVRRRDQVDVLVPLLEAAVPCVALEKVRHRQGPNLCATSPSGVSR